MIGLSIPLACALMLMALAVEAHHSIAGAYDTQQTVRVDGRVTRFAFVNPHAYVVLDVEGAASGRQVWRLEMDDRGELREIGMHEATLKPGDRLIVTGSPGRREANTMYIQRLQRPADGYGYEQVNSRPRLRPADR